MRRDIATSAAIGALASLPPEMLSKVVVVDDGDKLLTLAGEEIDRASLRDVCTVPAAIEESTTFVTEAQRQQKAEIKAWNAAVDRLKAERKFRQRANRGFQ